MLPLIRCARAELELKARIGQRRFETDDKSTNIAWLAVPSLGEAWHHNHQAFPRAAVQGMRWWKVDISGLTIKAMEKLHRAWNVIVISPSASSSASPAPPPHAKSARPPEQLASDD